MNIVLINHYAGTPKTGMEFRPYYLAREWFKNGHDVTIIAASNSHVRSVQPEVKNDLEIQIIDDVRYIWIKTPKYEGNSFGRIKNMFSFVFKLLKYSRQIVAEYKPDAVIASSTYPLDIFPSKKIAKLSGAKLFFEVHDLWPLSPMELGGYSKYHPFIMVMQYAENYSYRNCDAVISMLPKTLDHMISHGLKNEKFNYIPNGIVFEDWENPESIPEEHMNFIMNLKNEGKKVIAYTGAIGLANALDSYIDAAKILKDENIEFVIVGKGPEKESLKNKIEKEQIKNVHFLDPVKKTMIPDLLTYFDFLYIGLQNKSLFRFGISPNKLLDYFMAGKPVVQAINAGNNIVADYNCGFSAKAEDAVEISKAIRLMLNTDEKELNEMGKNGRDYVLKNHEYKYLASKFIDIMQNV